MAWAFSRLRFSASPWSSPPRRWPPSFGWPLTRASFRPEGLAGGGRRCGGRAGRRGRVPRLLPASLGRGVDYNEHTVYRSILESSGLALIAVVFLTLIIAGSINRYALGAMVVAWVVAASAFGFLDTRPVDGLYLFERPTRLETSSDYAAVVEQYQRTDASLEHETEEPPVEPVEVEEPPVIEPTIAPTVDAEESDPALAVPVFWVSGAFHTRYLPHRHRRRLRAGAVVAARPGACSGRQGRHCP